MGGHAGGQAHTKAGPMSEDQNNDASGVVSDVRDRENRGTGSEGSCSRNVDIIRRHLAFYI